MYEWSLRSDNVIDCHATTRGSIYRASRPSQGTVNGGAVSVDGTLNTTNQTADSEWHFECQYGNKINVS